MRLIVARCAVDIPAHTAREDRDGASELSPEEARDRCGRRIARQCGQASGNSWIGRSSIVPYLAPGHLCAHSIALSRFSTSSR